MATLSVLLESHTLLKVSDGNVIVLRSALSASIQEETAEVTLRGRGIFTVNIHMHFLFTQPGNTT